MNAALVLAILEAFDDWDAEEGHPDLLGHGAGDATIEEISAARSIMQAEDAVEVAKAEAANAVYATVIDTMMFEGLTVGEAIATMPEALRWRLWALVDVIGEVEVPVGPEDP